MIIWILSIVSTVLVLGLSKFAKFFCTVQNWGYVWIVSIEIASLCSAICIQLNCVCISVLLSIIVMWTAALYQCPSQHWSKTQTHHQWNQGWINEEKINYNYYFILPLSTDHKCQLIIIKKSLESSFPSWMCLIIL